MAKKAWSGRFTKATSKEVERFTESLSFDRKLYHYDILASIAHAQMLAKQGIISKPEAQQIVKGLRSIHGDFENGTFVFEDSHEDIHMAIEAALTEKIGQVGGKLHTARSRNDQVATDERLYLRDAIKTIVMDIVSLQEQFIALSEKYGDAIMPAYTHLQHAQPVLFSHHMMAYVSKFQRDAGRFIDCYKRANVLPLGSAAAAGTTYPIDRKCVAEKLGFASVCENSLDGVSDRDFIAEALFCAALTATHLSTLAEELVLWSSSEFDFIEISDAFTTGSSIMPQKKNPDVAELVRGKTGRFYGDLMALLVTLKGLPLAYNRDLQEDKPPLLDSMSQLIASLSVMTALLPEIAVKKENMRKAAQEGYLNATDAADYLAKKGVPFREAHAFAGKLVAYAIQHDKKLEELSLGEFKAVSERFEKDVFDAIKIENCVALRDSEGGTAPTRVKAQIDNAEKAIAATKKAAECMGVPTLDEVTA